MTSFGPSRGIRYLFEARFMDQGTAKHEISEVITSFLDEHEL
jgi:hypothetical protein